MAKPASTMPPLRTSPSMVRRAPSRASSGSGAYINWMATGMSDQLEAASKTLRAKALHTEGIAQAPMVSAASVAGTRAAYLRMPSLRSSSSARKNWKATQNTPVHS